LSVPVMIASPSRGNKTRKVGIPILDSMKRTIQARISLPTWTTFAYITAICTGSTS
jgi:hypothetical protein